MTPRGAVYQPVGPLLQGPSAPESCALIGESGESTGAPCPSLLESDSYVRPSLGRSLKSLPADATEGDPHFPRTLHTGHLPAPGPSIPAGAEAPRPARRPHSRIAG